jgi:hypothetical protein
LVRRALILHIVGNYAADNPAIHRSDSDASSNVGGMAAQFDKDVSNAMERTGLPVTQSADLPVRPFGAEPAEPAPAAWGAPPDAPAAAPARALLALAAVASLCTAVPAAGRCFANAKQPQKLCRARPAQPAVAAPAKKPGASRTIVLKGAGGSGFSRWTPIAADLMP